MYLNILHFSILWKQERRRDSEVFIGLFFFCLFCLFVHVVVAYNVLSIFASLFVDDVAEKLVCDVQPSCNLQPSSSIVSTCTSHAHIIIILFYQCSFFYKASSSTWKDIFIIIISLFFYFFLLLNILCFFVFFLPPVCKIATGATTRFRFLEATVNGQLVLACDWPARPSLLSELVHVDEVILKLWWCLKILVESTF